MRPAAGLKQLLEESGIPPESEAGQRMAGYLALLEKWNARISLTSTTEWSVIGPMFREGIWASRFYPAGAVSHLDIGSGAGFPALLLKMLIPRLELEMVESRERKCQFLETAAYTLGLAGTRVHRTRLSDLLQRCGEERRWDCISWKGLKLSAGELLQLHRHAQKETQLWMFHGKSPAAESTEAIGREFKLLRKEKVPGSRESHLSIYGPA